MGEVNIIMGAGTDSLIVDVVKMNVIMGAGMHSLVSADLGGRVGWLPKAEKVKTLFLSPLQLQNAGGVWGGG